MQLFNPSSSSIHEVAFDPTKDETLVLVSFQSSPESTYEYGPWPTSEVREIVSPTASPGATLSDLRKRRGEFNQKLDGGVAANAAAILPRPAAGRASYDAGATSPLAF